MFLLPRIYVLLDCNLKSHHQAFENSHGVTVRPTISFEINLARQPAPKMSQDDPRSANIYVVQVGMARRAIPMDHTGLHRITHHDSPVSCVQAHACRPVKLRQSEEEAGHSRNPHLLQPSTSRTSWHHPPMKNPSRIQKEESSTSRIFWTT